MNRTLIKKTAPHAVLAAGLVAGLAVTLGGALPTSAAEPAGQKALGWHASCTTNSSGACSVANRAGAVPDSVTVSPSSAVTLYVKATTASTITVRAGKLGSSAGYVGAITFDVHVDYTPTTSTPTTSPATSPPTTGPTSSPTPSPGAGWPDSSNTGVPAGTVLTDYTGPCTITAANTVIDAKNVNCDLTIQADGVTITRSKVTGSIASPDDLTTTAGFSISDSYVSYPSVGPWGRTMLGATNFSVLRTEVVGGNRGIYCRKSCTIRDSYVHGTMVIDAQHASGIRMSMDGTIVHNTIWCSAEDVGDAGCSADLTGYGDFDPVQNNLIQNNLFHATPGGACAYGGSSKTKPYSDAANHVRFIDNVFQRGSSTRCGWYFPITDFDTAAPGNVWSGNVWDDGSVVPPA